MWMVYPLLTAGLFFTLLRLLRGPTLADRVVALDLLGFVMLGFVAAHVALSRQVVFVDVLVVAAIVLFLGTVAFARYLERRGP